MQEMVVDDEEGRRWNRRRQANETMVSAGAREDKSERERKPSTAGLRLRLDTERGSCQARQAQGREPMLPDAT